MTESANSNDQAERLRRLQERRAASGRPSPSATANGGSTVATAPAKKGRRRHPAAATRVLLAGLSVTSFFAVGGAIAVANHTTAVAQSTAVPASNTLTGSATKASSTAGSAAQPAPAASVVVHTTTGGS